MATWILHVLRIKADRRAVTAIEYALVAALVAVVIIKSLTTTGRSITNTFQTIANEL